MRLPIARLLVKAAKWLAPRVKQEIEDEVLRKTGVDVRQGPGVPLDPTIPQQRASDLPPVDRGPQTGL